MNRLDQLKKFLEEDPHDPFNIYALALEYQKTDRSIALRLFNQLIHEYPDYLATYYHLAKLYQELNQKENAIKIFENGIERSRALKEMKTMRELQSAYDELLF